MKKLTSTGKVSKRWLMKKAQKAFNGRIRERDKGKPCCSCSEFKELEAGHYISVGASSIHRFNPMNVHGQCSQCNAWKSGNHVPYREFMIKEYGLEAVEELEQTSWQPKKWSVEELEEIINE